jgi:hypothetical protein
MTGEYPTLSSSIFAHTSASHHAVMIPRIAARRVLAVFLMALAATVAAAACGDLTKPKASYSNTTDTVLVYALNGTPVNSPAGITLVGATAVPISASFGFDVAFDIDAQGKATMYSVRYVAGGLSGAHSVAMQRYTGDFDALDRAPQTGYVTDSLLTASTGDVFLLSSADPLACAYSVYSNVIYAKLQVLGIDPGTRTLRTRFTVNPNCGFYSLIPSGVPKD